MKQETYLDRIKKLKSSRKITNEMLAGMTGIPFGTLAKLLAGINDSPKFANIVAISRALDCSLDWLITGVPVNTNNYTLEPSEMEFIENYRLLDGYGQDLVVAVAEKERQRTERQRAERPSGEEGDAAPEEGRKSARILPAAPVAFDVKRVPPSAMRDGRALPDGLRRRRIGLYDMPVSAGTGEFLSDTFLTEILIPDDERTAEAEYALRVAGDSMEPRYRTGDMILVQSAESVEEGELGIFILDGCGYFKKFGGDCLLSLNPAYPPISLREFDRAFCCGRVVGKLKRR